MAERILFTFVDRITSKLASLAVREFGSAWESTSSDTECVTDAVKFFLGLDDVWNEDPVEWKKLQDLLTFGGLSDKQCLSILVKWAFKEGEEQNHKDLVDIVREMVKKCGGVPLANDILPVFGLSYDQKPPSLKLCFAYCSLYEKDQVIDRQQLIYRWMAQGFIQEKQNEALEGTAECYFDELVRRSFLVNANFGRGYKMHDLVHDLAQFVTGNDCLTLNDNIKVVPERVIHVSFNNSLYSEVPWPLLDVEKLRTVVFPHRRKHTFGSSVETVFRSFRYLRVVDFNNDSERGQIKVLATSITNLF
ncbi:hypothetical protein Acr_00g0014950 [Actinidia rufa]|uniref:Disease resistance protein winged helix domain-containing protein n=1 Tax=Actinidia rufa TaxID=165716 RepID=A0A7J0DC70_9ERIC|nr:hypothetical protein Acr_00g0014950 [Actinidia rufa]